MTVYVLIPPKLPPCVCGLRRFYPGKCICWVRPPRAEFSQTTAVSDSGSESE